MNDSPERPDIEYYLDNEIEYENSPTQKFVGGLCLYILWLERELEIVGPWQMGGVENWEKYKNTLKDLA